MKRFNWDTGFAAKTLATKLAASSFSELEDFCLDVQRRIVLAQGELKTTEIIATRLAYWSQRRETERPTLTFCQHRPSWRSTLY